MSRIFAHVTHVAHVARHREKHELLISHSLPEVGLVASGVGGDVCPGNLAKLFCPELNVVHGIARWECFRELLNLQSLALLN